jgi:hypothetical protein
MICRGQPLSMVHRSSTPHLASSELWARMIAQTLRRSLESARGLLLAPDASPMADRRQVRKELLAYCERDTLAMVKLTDRLGGLASQRGFGVA